jgi:3-oxoadipate enol-lactonase/4-carboxymuconolactone decarboxylase
MTPQVTAVELTQSRERPLLVVGSSLGTSVTALWGRCARLLENRFHVVGWDLPGHGRNTAPAPERLSMADLAAGVLAWGDRRELVLQAGTQAVVESSRQRWFGPDFEARDPGTAQLLIDSLAETGQLGHAAVCGALADFDVRDRLGEIATPVLAIAGSADLPTPPALLRELADGVQHGRYAELSGIGHLAPAEAPVAVAQLIARDALISRINQSTAHSFLPDIDSDS